MPRRRRFTPPAIANVWPTPLAEAGRFVHADGPRGPPASPGPPAPPGDAIDRRAQEEIVRRLQQGIFEATQYESLKKVRNLQKSKSRKWLGGNRLV